MPKLVSVIISARNEFPQIVFTVHSILDDLGSFLKPSEFEVIIVDNLSNDEKVRQTGIGGTVDFLRARGAFHNGMLRVLYDPIAGNVSARNKGAEIARGKYVFFSDAHMMYSPGFFKRMIETLEEYPNSLVHPSYSWMGAYPPQPSYQYSWKLGEEFKATWANYKLTDTPFAISGSGHCSFGVSRERFEELKGYPDYLRCYGGGEVYLDTLWWMAGNIVLSEPRAHCYHLSAGRGYSYQHNDYIHNIFHSAIILGADMWAERTYLNYLRKGKKEVLDNLWKQAEEEAQPRREFVASVAKHSFNDVIRTRPWDEWNMRVYGKKNSGMLVFQDTWLPLIQGTPAEAAYPGKYQEELAKFIDDHLSEVVYRRAKEKGKTED